MVGQFVGSRHLFKLVRTGKRSERRFAEEFKIGARGHRAVGDFSHQAPLELSILFRAGSQFQVVTGEIADAGDIYLRSQKCQWQTVGPQRHGLHFTCVPLKRQIEPAAEPTVLGVVRVGTRRVPDVHRAEMRTVGIRVPDSLDDGQLPFVIQFLESRHLRVQAQRVVDLEHVGFGNANPGTGLVVLGVAVRDHRVEPVVASRHLHEDEYPPAGRLVLLLVRCPGGSRKERRRGNPERNYARSTQLLEEHATIRGHGLSWIYAN